MNNSWQSKTPDVLSAFNSTPCFIKDVRNCYISYASVVELNTI